MSSRYEMAVTLSASGYAEDDTPITQDHV